MFTIRNRFDGKFVCPHPSGSGHSDTTDEAKARRFVSEMEAWAFIGFYLSRDNWEVVATPPLPMTVEQILEREA